MINRHESLRHCIHFPKRMYCPSLREQNGLASGLQTQMFGFKKILKLFKIFSVSEFRESYLMTLLDVRCLLANISL